MEKIKLFSQKIFKIPALITMFLLSFILISFGAKSLISAINSDNSTVNDYKVTFPANLEGISENGLQYAISKKSTKLIGTYEDYGNWQPTAGTNSIKIKNSDKIKFLVKFDEGYSHLKVEDVKILDNGSKEAFSLKVYDYSGSDSFIERDPQKDELIIPGKNYPTSELKVNKNLNLSFSGIKEDNYSLKIAMKEEPQKTKEALDVYYYFSNESEKKKMDFSENSNSYELNNLTYGMGINVIIERTAPYTQTGLDFNDIEGIDEFINKTQTTSGVKLNTSVNKDYDIKINKSAEKNTYSVKNSTSGTIEYKILSENEYNALASGNSFTASYGENYDFKYENLEKTLVANGKILHQNNYNYSLYNISENLELSTIEELSGASVPIYFPAQEHGILIVDETGENQITNSSVKYGNSFSFRLKQADGYTQNFSDIEVYKNNVLGSEKTLLSPNNENSKDECSGLYTITDIRQPVKIETSKPVKNLYAVSVAQNLKNAKIDVSGQNVHLDESTQNLGTKIYNVEHGGNLEITVTPNEGYTTENMYLDVNADITPYVSLENNKFKVSPIKSDTTLSVRNIQGTSNVNFASGYEYAETSEQSQTVNKGDNFSFKLKSGLEDENFMVKANNTQLKKGFNGNYTISNIQENQSITIEPDKSKNVTLTIEKSGIPDDATISYKINDGQSVYQDAKNIDSLEVPVDSSITFQNNSNNNSDISIKNSNEGSIQTFNENNQYTVNNIISPLKVSFSKGGNNNLLPIKAWSLAKKYTFGTDAANKANDYEIKFKDQPTDISGATASDDGKSFDVQFKKIENESGPDFNNNKCQGFSGNKSYFGPENLNIKLDYGVVNNANNFIGFKVDGTRYDPGTGQNVTDEDIFSIKGNNNKGKIANNINQTVNNTSKSYDLGNATTVNGSGHKNDVFSRYNPDFYSISKYPLIPAVFKQISGSFATLFEFFDLNSLLGSEFFDITRSNPLCTRKFNGFNETNTAWGGDLFTGYTAPQNKAYKIHKWPYLSNGNGNFASLFISQNLNFNKENHDKENLMNGDLNYNIQSSYINRLNNDANYNYSYAENSSNGYSFSYNSRLFNNSHGLNISSRTRGSTNVMGRTFATYQYYYPTTQYLGAELTGSNYQNNVASTSAYDESGENEESLNFAYMYDTITLTPIFNNSEFVTQSEIEFPLETRGLDFYETYIVKDDQGNDVIKKSIQMTKNSYIVETDDINISAKFNFIIHADKNYDFDPNSVQVYPEGFGTVSCEEMETEGDYLYTINNIYSDNLKVRIPTPEKHKYAIRCNLFASNFYDVTDGEKFLVKNIESGSDFTFETEPQTGYNINNEILDIAFEGKVKTLDKDVDSAELVESTDPTKRSTITRDTNTQSIRNRYEIKNLSGDITLTSSREKRSLAVTFIEDPAFEYLDSDGNPLKDKALPEDKPADADYFILRKPYGYNINFTIQENEGYSSSNLAALANGTPIEYTNGQYKIKNISENTTVKVENIEKINCKLVFTQHEGISFKDSKDNDLGSEKELKYGDTFTFKTEIQDSYEKSENNYHLKLEYSSGKDTEILKSHKDMHNEYPDEELYKDANPNIYTITEIKENCRIYVEGLDYKKHNIKLYNSKGIIFQDKYGIKPLDEDTSKEYITQTALHGQTFSFKVKADEGYDISGMKLFAKKDVSGTRQQLFPSNDVYTIEDVTEDYTVTLENVEKTKYSVEIRLTEGVKCVDQNGDTMQTGLTMAHGDDLSFYLSLDGAYSKASPTVTVKGVLNPIIPDASGKYTIPNITENKIIEISRVKKNTYKATFVATEGVIYKNNKNKPFENSLDVEYGESLYFKITLMDAYDKSTPLVMMNDNKVIAESAGIYTVTNINSDITITVKNVNKNPEEITMEDVNNVPDPVVTDEDVNSVVKATLTYENLSDEEKEQVTNIAALQKAQKEAGELNHKSGNIYVNGVDWNIKVIATELTKDEEKMNYLNSKIDRRELINLYDIYLLDLLTGKTYELPYGKTVDVTMPAPGDLTGYQNVVIAHEKSSGNIEYLDVNITDDNVKFTATSFSLFGLAAKKIPNYAESPSSTQISVSSLVENEEELKTLLGEGVVSQIGDLTQPDNSSSFPGSSGDSSEKENSTMSWWQKFYKWALNNEFLAVLLILLFGSGAIWLILLLAKKRQESE